MTPGATAVLFFSFETPELLVVLLVVLLSILLSHTVRLRRERNALLNEKDVVFSFVHDVGEVFADAGSVDLNALLKRVLYYALHTTKAGSGALYLVDADGDHLRAHAISGVFPPIAGGLGPEVDRAFSKIKFAETLVRTQSVRVGDGLIGEVASTGAPILIPDAESDPRVPRFTIDFFQIHSVLLVPMRFRNECLGVLVVVNRVDGLPFIQADQGLLQALADQASVSIHYAKFSVALDEKRRLDYDLSIARRIQAALLPKVIPRIVGSELAAFSVPAQEIGGDYYDFVPVDDHHLGIAIADVSGKGVSAAIVMSICRSLLQLQAPGCPSPATVLMAMNQRLAGDMAEDMFISMLYMVLDTRTGELAVARAGHTAPFVIPADHSEARMIECQGMALGMADAETFDAAIDEVRVPLRKGDMVVGYTDGVTEAMDQAQNEWGVLNLVKTMQLASMDGVDAAAAAAQVQRKLLHFAGETRQYDDMTLVVLRMT